MSDRTRDDADKASRPTTILDPLRPAVVVRRRVYDAALSRAEESAHKGFTTVSEAPQTSEDDESGPPSSINVARALASLRADELQRVEELLRADEEDEDDDDEEQVEQVEGPREAQPAAPAVPTVLVGKTIALSELAQKMGVPANELPATLVARGYYALTAKTVLPRETAKVIADMFGFRVEDAPEQEEQAPAKSGRRSRIATKVKPKPKATTRGGLATDATSAAKSAKTAGDKTTKAKSTRRRVAR